MCGDFQEAKKSITVAAFAVLESRVKVIVVLHLFKIKFFSFSDM